ncbi:hypothetical protein O988_08588 [Pseudogymnoascus sp. VKM F-3808]|nr:hypothetical protein O988_08588 [Pseudogymnoascus sp. VKM F-3808]
MGVQSPPRFLLAELFQSYGGNKAFTKRDKYPAPWCERSPFPSPGAEKMRKNLCARYIYELREGEVTRRGPREPQGRGHELRGATMRPQKRPRRLRRPIAASWADHRAAGSEAGKTTSREKTARDKTFKRVKRMERSSTYVLSTHGKTFNMRINADEKVLNTRRKGPQNAIQSDRDRRPSNDAKT